MRKLVYYIATSIDGNIAAANGSFEAFPMSGDHFETLVREFPDTFPSHVHGPLGITDPSTGRFDTVLMGRRSYQPSLDAGIESPYAHLRQVVFSRTLTARDEAGLTIIAKDPLEVVATLKSETGKDIWLCGGADLATTLAPLVDELILKVNPVLIPGGIPLLQGGAVTDWTLTDTRSHDSGVVISRYSRR